MTDALLDTSAIAAAYRAGATYARICSEYNVSERQARNVLRGQGLRLGPGARARVPAEVQERMCAMVDAGMAKAAIARATGWSTGAVIRAVQRRDRT